MSFTHYINIAVSALWLMCAPLSLEAQTTGHKQATDTIHAGQLVPEDSLARVDKLALADNKALTDNKALADTTKEKKHKRDWATWKPNPKRAMWLALVMPGAGQIYNRKYWKLPIFYGGFVGCAYALRWNNMMYRDYSQAYLDIMDNDPTTQSYNQFLHLGTQITSENQAQWQEVFRKRKDRYRRWRDLSFFVMVGVYALSVIDAYVDASLSEFDISPNLSFHFSPAIMNSSENSLTTFTKPAVGLQCGFTF